MQPKILKKITAILLLPVVAIVIIHFFSRHHNEAAAKAPNQRPVVRIANIATRNIPLTVAAYGMTQSPKSVVIAAKSDGIIKAIKFTSGAYIKKGQPLFQIQSTNSDNQIKKIKANLEADHAKYLAYQSANKKTPGIISRVDLNSAKAKYKGDLSAYQTATEAVDIPAPINGMASARQTSIGSFVQSGQKLLSIIDPASLQIQFSLPSQYGPQLKIGQAVLVSPTSSQQHYQATVSYIDPQLSADGNDITVHAKFNHNLHLRPNVFAKITLTLDPHYKTLALAQSLVQSDAQGFYVYGIRDNRVSKMYF